MADYKNTTVIIACAGMGTRLGIGNTKALVDICGKPLILRQLELLDDFDDVRIVVGYQAESLINVVNSYRKDITFVFNHEYAHTSVADSFRLGMKYARKYTICIDGDLLIEPESFRRFISCGEECILVAPRSSSEPVMVTVRDGMATDFGQSGDWEWAGVSRIKTERISGEFKYMYELLTPLLPIKYIEADVKDIDTQDDYDMAIKWYSKLTGE